MIVKTSRRLVYSSTLSSVRMSLCSAASVAGPGWWRVAAVPVAVRRGTRHLCRLKYTGQSKHRNNHSAKCFLHLTWIIDCTDCTAQCHQDQPVDISRPAVGSRSGCPVASIVYTRKHTLPFIILQQMLELQLFSIHLSNITFYYFSEMHVQRTLCWGK